MDMKKTIITSAIASVALLAGSNAQAQGFYIYGEGAHTDISSSAVENEIRLMDREGRAGTEEFNEVLDQFGLTADLEYTSSFSSDDSGTTFGVGVGYQVNDNVAIEFAYRDLGDASYKNSFQVTGTEASGTGTRELGYESKAFILRGVGILPVTDRLSLEAMLGVAHVDTDYKGSEVVSGQGFLDNTSVRESDSGRGFSATYGVGASFAVTDTLTTFARWERIHDIDTENLADGIEADTFSAGIRYHF